MRCWCTITFCCFIIIAIADNDLYYETKGWHWYNESSPLKRKEKQSETEWIKQFNQMPAYRQLQILQRVTTNLRDRAILSGKVNDVAAYKKAQDFWVNRSTLFTMAWEQMLLQHPDLDYSLRYSHENALAPIMARIEHEKENKAITELAKTKGLLFFYRGNNESDRFFSEIVNRYADRYHFSLIPISVDSVVSPVFKDRKNNRTIDGKSKAEQLGIRYFPALVLVNPETHQYAVVNYGFKSEMELSERLLKIVNQWKPNF